MKKEIKERLEAVRQGEVPDGYRIENGYLIPDDWKTVPLNSRFTRSTRKNKEGCENVLTISAQMGLVNQREFYDKDIASDDKSGYFLMKNGEFAYNKSYSTGYPYGAIKQLTKYDEGIVSPLYICFAPKAGTNTAFYTQYFEGGRYNREIYRIAQEGARNHGLLNVAVEDFFTGTLVEPSAGEQQKIAEILATCDRAIELKKAEIESTITLIHSLNNQLFPRLGEDAPLVRFPGFEEKWQRCKLLSCIERIIDFRGRTPKKLGMDWSEDGYLALSALNVKDGYIDFSQDVHYGDTSLYLKWMKGNELHKGQVVFTTEAPMGNVAQIPDDNGYILSQRTIAFVVKEDQISEDFLSILLRTPSVKTALKMLSSGGTAQGVSQRTLAALEVVIPTDLREQQAIADLFIKLNTLIELHQQELQELLKRKRALMQRLLTGLVRV